MPKSFRFARDDATDDDRWGVLEINSAIPVAIDRFERGMARCRP